MRSKDWGNERKLADRAKSALTKCGAEEVPNANSERTREDANNDDDNNNYASFILLLFFNYYYYYYYLF